jgi:hypothetical protein
MATSLNSTTLAAAVAVNQNYIKVASASNLSAPNGSIQQKIYVINPGSAKGELMHVTGINGTVVSVSRLDQFRSAFLSGAYVLIAPQDVSIGVAFQERDPNPGDLNSAYSPWVNVVTGHQWLYSSVLGAWVPGFNNPLPAQPTAAVASAAGLITPSGPLCHVTGALAVTGLTLPVGFTGGIIRIIPDGAFTWTAANNIAVLGQAVVNKMLELHFDFNSGLFYPSYVA